MSDRYSVSEEEGYEPGSHDQVLKNYLGIKEKLIIEQLEARELMRAEQEIFSMYTPTTIFRVEDICEIHRLWLGNIYAFAGSFRSVNMSKDSFPFAGAPYISNSMQKFEKDYLSKYTPCFNVKSDDLAMALAIIHIEFILIHPFREGNGRVARLLAVLMALQADMPPLNFSLIDQTKNIQGFKKYIDAIHVGVDQNYLPMQEIFLEIIKNSIP